MPETQQNLFSTLRRLFSTDVIIRNDGGNMLSVMDTDNIQSNGVIQTNSLIDRFHKVYTTSTAYGVNLNLAMNYQSSRVQIYADYDAMDTDAIIASALDIIADECLGADTVIPLVIPISSGNKKTIKDLYEEGVKDFWVYGLNTEDKTVEPIKAEKVAYNGKKEVYRITLDDGTEVKATSNHIWISENLNQKFTEDLQEGDYILSLNDSYEAGSHRVVKIEKCGFEDVYDIVNAGDNHIFAIETKDGSKLYTHNCTLKNEQGQVLTIRSSDESIQKTLENLFYSVLNIEFNLWSWIRNMCIHEDTMIPLLDGREVKIKDLAAEIKANPNKEYWTYSVQEGTNNVVPGKITWCGITRENAELVRVTLDDGTYIDVTPDHKFILRDGSKKEAQHLTSGESLMPFYNNNNDSNHEAVSVIKLENKANTYCMNVVGPNGEEDQHNFAVCSNNLDGSYTRNGVFISNCKYGDFYLKMEISEKFGVYNVIPFSAYNIVRQEGYNPHNPNEVRFKFDPNAALSATSGYTSAYNNQDPGVWFDNYEMAHFRLIGDVNYLPYGRSYLEPARKLFKQYTLIEDAMLIHRVTRAPERRIFYVNVGAIPPNEVEGYVQKMINKMKKTPLIDPNTGNYNLKYNQQNLLEDFFIPVRGNDSTTRIDTAKGLEYNAIEDVQYFREKMFAALKIPKAFMGYEKDLTGKCLHPDTKISLLDGTTKTIKEIADLFEKDKNTDLWTYSFDFKENKVVPGKIVAAEKTRLNAQLVRVRIDNGTYVDTTPDHGFLLEDGTRVDAQDLEEGNSLKTIIIDKLEGTYNNHKVVRVVWLKEKVDTYNMEVHDNNENHNYLLDNQLVIKNSTLAAEDIRFARTVERLQRIVVSELKKMALVHLYANGYTDDSMANFQLSLTNPSIIYDQERVAMFKEKIDLANQALEGSILPREYVWENIFHMSPDSFQELDDMIVQDKKRKFRYEQIETEGNDPLESGQAFGTPHQIAGLYGGQGVLDVPAGYNELNPEEPVKMPGRPEKYKSTFRTDKSNFGRDGLGRLDLGPNAERGEGSQLKSENKAAPLSFESTMAVYLKNKDSLKNMFPNRKVSLFEGESDKSTLLDERNIKDEQADV